jgi:hypothetical protein
MHNAISLYQRHIRDVHRQSAFDEGASAMHLSTVLHQYITDVLKLNRLWMPDGRRETRGTPFWNHATSWTPPQAAGSNDALQWQISPF